MMFSQTILIPTCIILVFQAALQGGFASAKESVDSPIDKVSTTDNDGTDNDAGDAADNVTATLPDFVVESVAGKPCILATVNISLRVSYTVTSKRSKHEYIAFKDIEVPLDADVSQDSVCGDTESSLILEWDNSTTFHLNLTFGTLKNEKGENPTNWSLTAVGLSFNITNNIMFPGAVDDEYRSDSKSNLALFNTFIGHSGECDKVTKIPLGHEDKEIEVIFSYVRFAAFNLTSDEFPKEVDTCSQKESSQKKEDIVVPLIIACSLSLVVIIVVIAYAISRKVQEARDQTQYKPMP